MLPASSALAANDALVVALSPWSAQRLSSPMLAEPLVAAVASDEETRALRATLADWEQGGNPMDRTALETFLNAYPTSAWRPAILGNLGLAAASAGRYSQALSDWDAAWQAGRDITHPGVRTFIDRIVGEELSLRTRLGHSEAVATRLAELLNRPLSGSASEALIAAREGLWKMHNQPETSFLCGPLALQQLLPNPKAGYPMSLPADSLPADSLPAKPGGYNLGELAELATQEGLALQAMHRDIGAVVPVPAIVHWKTGHYAALIAERNGQYQIRDAAMGAEYWISRETLDAESSGFYLTRQDSATQAGWREANAEESKRIVGAGYTGGFVDTETPPCETGDCSCSGGDTSADSTEATGMIRARVQAMLVSLALADTPIAYSPSKGPRVPLKLTYSQREAYQPATFTYFNFGPKWSFTGLSYLLDNPTSVGNGVQRYMAGGGTKKYAGYNGSTGKFSAESGDQSVLVLTSSNPVTYERRLSDGSKEIYGQSDGKTAYPRHIFLTQVIDPVGNALIYTYDSQMRLTTLTDATGKATTLQYTHADPLLVTGITDPFGRQATITYDTQGRLASITDVIGITSAVGYSGTSAFIDRLTTPYGTSTFKYGESGSSRWLEMTNPQGATERVETLHGAPGIPFSESLVPSGINAFNAYINGRNTFYWDQTAYARAQGDYTKARIKHWYHEITNTSLTAGVLESIKDPLENRVWFNYPGQNWAGAQGTCDKPSAIARVLPDGTTQMTRMAYNDQGKLLTRTDPKGRITAYEYDSAGLDLLRVKQKTAVGYDTQLEMTWNSQHRPLTIKDAAGQVTALTYNTAGQILTQTNPKGETTTYQYDSQGNLVGIVNALGKTQATYAYDSYGRLASGTDSEGYTLLHEYDALNHRIRTTFPDGTTRETTWDRLDIAAQKDRNGKQTRYSHDANRKLTAVTDPLNHTVSYGYQENGLLASLTDANGNTTRWERDIQGRITAKVYPDGSRDSLAYDNAGRVTDLTDAPGQTERRTYGVDDRLTGIQYLNAQNPTPAVSLVDAGDYPRLIRQIDGLGTTNITYVPAGTPGAGRVQSIDGPYANDTITLAYDPLGHLQIRILGNAANSTETFTYDALGRLSAKNNPLGSFSFTYLGQTGQPTYQLLANGMGTAYRYGDNSQDRRLKAILNLPSQKLKPNDGSSPRDWRYHSTPENLIQGRKAHPGNPEGLHYDDAYRLVGQTRGLALGLDGDDFIDDGSIGPINGPWTTRYAYDPADNLTEVSTADTRWTATPNANNQYQSAKGTNWAYDQAGNLSDDGQRIYTWDGAHRLISVIDKTSGKKSQFVYDGQSRLTVRKEYENASATAPSEIRYLWCGDQVCQARDAQDTVTGRYYAEGELQGTTALYYTRDHLGSVMETTQAGGAVMGKLDYSAYGETETATGRLPDFRYAGMLYHAPTGFYLTHYRVYDPTSGRWLSRDPIAEQGGINLYSYVGGNPISRIDPFGLDWVYSQSTGQVTHVDPSGNTTNVGTGYAGQNAGLNNPANQSVPGTGANSNGGPLPQGTYTIGAQQNNVTGAGTRLPASMRLIPDPT